MLPSCTSAETSKESAGIQNVVISAHRGGPLPGYPENALETLQNTEKRIPGVMMEVDVRLTKDGVLVLLHDATLDRTTNFSGRLDNYTYEEISTAFLMDLEEKVTLFHIPTLKSVFLWITEVDAYLSLDVKESLAVEAIVQMIDEFDLGDRVEVITYNRRQAEQVHQLDSSLHLSVSLGNMEAIQQITSSNVINQRKIAAFTGLSLKDQTFYQQLADLGFVVTLGTIGNLDRRAEARGNRLYLEWQALGVARFATDYPFRVFDVLSNQAAQP
ncbi:MAG: glycerophosphodiester phosphodiesterase family protein [Bacteroidota bacterium]